MMPNTGGGGAQSPYPQMPPQQGYTVQQQMQHQQQMMMMMQQRQQFPQQQQMFNTNPGFMPVQGGFVVQRGVSPPQYTPRMAKDFKQKQSQMQKQQQKFIENQQKKMESTLKQRQFHEQQKRLKEFSSMGGRPMDADRLIQSIIGKTDTSRSQTAVAPPVGKNVPSVQSVQSVEPQDDNFGDFMGGPSVTVNTPQNTDSSQPVSSSASLSGPPQQPSPVDPPPTQPLSHPPTGIDPKQDKKDLMAMMMECSDLNAPQKAKGFVKPTVKDIQPAKKTAASFQESRQARRWDTSTDTLTELFTVPLPQPAPTVPAAPTEAPPALHAQPTGQAPAPGPGSAPGVAVPMVKLPRWVTGEAPLPDVYHHVLEASLVDDKISTERLYPILLRSNLPREQLGYLWNLCNKQSPGQLTRPELIMLMAMISVAQNNLKCTSLEILGRCPQPPIPNLGQNTAVPVSGPSPVPVPGVPSPAPVSGAPQAAPVPADSQTQLAPGLFIHPAHTPQNTAAPTVTNGTVDDSDFADFQSAPTLPPVVPPPGMATSATSTGQVDNFFLVNRADGGSATNESADKYRALQDAITDPERVLVAQISSDVCVELKKKDDEDIDQYFNGKKKVPPLPTSDPADPFQRNKKLSAPSCEPRGKLEAEFNLGGLDIATKAKGDLVMPDFESFGALARSHSESSSCQSQGWTSSSSNSVLTTGSSNTDDFADFTSADNQPNDEFTDFKQYPDQGTPVAEKNQLDKYSALKALVQNKSLFSEKPRNVVDSSDSSDVSAKANHHDSLKDVSSTLNDLTVTEDEWASLSSAPLEHQDTTPVSLTQVDEPGNSVQLDWTPAFSSESAPPENNWAAFGTEQHNQQPTCSNSIIASSDQQPQVKSSSTKKEERMKVDKRKAEQIFSKNVPSRAAPFSTFGMSAYDMAPPELPDIKDDVDEFDEFGTFQTGDAFSGQTSEGISSLAAGLDDFGDFAVPSSTSAGKSTSRLTSQNIIISSHKDIADSSSTSSMEFSGWKSQTQPAPKEIEDSQSMQSLDLKSTQKEESPSGVDSQSVSSLDFPQLDKKAATPQDGKSVASLELQTSTDIGFDESPSEAVEQGLEVRRSDEGFGDFSSAKVVSPDEESLKHWATAPPEDHGQKPRNVSELMTHGDLLTVGDRYSGLIKEPQDTDKHTYCWQRCLEKGRKLLGVAVDALHTTSNSTVCKEIVQSEKGAKFMRGVLEVYRVSCRIRQAMKAASISNQKLVTLVEEIEDIWVGLTMFITNTELMPDKSTLDFSQAVLKSTQDNSQQKTCGVCILNVDTKCSVDNGHKLSYGGRQYHASCANFWVNCVDSTLPALSIPELL